MKLGKFEIEQLSEGIFEVFDDGIFVKVDAKDITTRESDSFTIKESMNIGIDPILIRNGKQIIQSRPLESLNPFCVYWQIGVIAEPTAFPEIRIVHWHTKGNTTQIVIIGKQHEVGCACKIRGKTDWFVPECT